MPRRQRTEAASAVWFNFHSDRTLTIGLEQVTHDRMPRTRHPPITLRSHRRPGRPARACARPCACERACAYLAGFCEPGAALGGMRARRRTTLAATYLWS